MKVNATINSEGYVVSPAETSILGITFYLNKKISFLPVRVDETFPNLIAYSAADCSLTSVSRINFKNLKKMKTLNLRNNQIVKVKSDTFEDLTLLEVLWLGKTQEFWNSFHNINN